METTKSFDYKSVKKHRNHQFLWVRNEAINLWNDQIFWIRKVSIFVTNIGNRRKDQIFWLQKCQETWKRPIPRLAPAALGSGWDYDFGKGQNPFITWTFQHSNLPIFQPSDLLIFQPFPKKVSRNRRIDQILWILQRIWSFHTFIATFSTHRDWSFPCFFTLSVFKGFGCFSCL